MSNYTKTNVGNESRTELHEALSLTGAEVSINFLPAGAGVPFVHSHRNNEEIYGIIAGKGTAIIDGDTVEITAGDWLKSALQQSVNSSQQMTPASLMSAFR